MHRISPETTTKIAANNNSPSLSAIKALMDRHVSELKALASSPGERVILAQMACTAIERGLCGVQS
ncbi:MULTISPECIES: hypothetical protein [Acidiphilium]|uniref:Uncharacterized protein n=1 Tax=Acidiphilium rubrum TaxID=526 RepID=A0A8G2CJ75_ACIRU|nr:MULTISPECIES: hypothetical protein [Acidiphilium]SIQ46126.1 hypothetical protein SAMN05421828_10517 [Acidiphilium rubrum]